MGKKKLKSKKRVLEARIYRLENHIQELETHTYGAVSDDIERLHEQVDMWADVPLKDRVEGIETRECSAAIEELRDSLEQEYWMGDLDTNETISPLEQLLQGLPEVEKKRIRDIQVTPTEAIPAWLLAKRNDGSFYLNRYYVPDGEDLAIGEQMFEVTNLDQLEDLVQYIQDTLAVTGWDEGQL